MRAFPRLRVRPLAACAGVAAAAMLLASCISFAAPVSTQASLAAEARSINVAFADVTGDGSDDPLVLTSLGELVRLAPCGDGCLERREVVTTATNAAGLVTADFDGDDIQDVAVSSNEGVRVYFGGAAGPGRPEGLVATDSVLATSDTGGLVAGELDGDGDADLGVLSFNEPGPAYRVVPGDGAGGFGATQVVMQFSPSPRVRITGLAAGDVDADGDLEGIVTGYALLFTGEIIGSVSVAGDDPDDSFSRSTNSPLAAADARDLDGDGRADVIANFTGVPPSFGLSSSFLLLRSTGTSLTGFGPGGAETTFRLGTAPVGSYAVRDLDDDGNADLIGTVPETGRVSWRLGQGDGTFVPTNGQQTDLRQNAGAGARTIAFGHVAGGALADLLVANSTQPFAQVSYLINRSTP